jgi:hypothetical protein
MRKAIEHHDLELSDSISTPIPPNLALPPYLNPAIGVLDFQAREATVPGHLQVLGLRVQGPS